MILRTGGLSYVSPEKVSFFLIYSVNMPSSNKKKIIKNIGSGDACAVKLYDNL